MAQPTRGFRRRLRCDSGSLPRQGQCRAEEIEGDFSRLIDALQIRIEAIDVMAELAVQSQFGGLTNEDDATIEEQKKVAIAKHRRALKNNLTLFQS